MLRAELGDVNRFGCIDQVVAYAGLDIEVKESGKWSGTPRVDGQGKQTAS